MPIIDLLSHNLLTLFSDVDCVFFSNLFISFLCLLIYLERIPETMIKYDTHQKLSSGLFSMYLHISFLSWKIKQSKATHQRSLTWSNPGK